MRRNAVARHSAMIRHSSVTRSIRRGAAMLALLLLAMLGAAGTASAHDVLISSDPADGSTVATAPDRMTLTFDQPVQNFNPVLVVSGPNGNVYTSGPAIVDGNSVWAPLGRLGAAGEYRAAYRVVSADGHPVTGEISFTAAASAAGTATGSAPADGQAIGVPSAGSGSGGPSGWLWVGIAVAVVAIVGGAVIALRRPKLRP